MKQTISDLGPKRIEVYIVFPDKYDVEGEDIVKALVDDDLYYCGEDYEDASTHNHNFAEYVAEFFPRTAKSKLMYRSWNTKN